MLIKGESIIINSTKLVYILADKEKGIGEIGFGNYGEGPITQITASPENALALQKSWLQSCKDSELRVINPRRTSKPRRAVKKGAKK